MLVSTGGNDKCMFVWATDFGREDLEPIPDYDEEPPEVVDIYIPNQPRKNEEQKERTKAKVEAAVESNNESAIFRTKSTRR
mmetsp:Transcript_13274/g.2080  ORF Transcript_13274/g.2080 Transcript_13274/m.2080 type:complete len:81 (+) Transcript_13274:244-486(+)